MVEEYKGRIDEAVTKGLEEVDKTYFRVLQGRMYKCAAKCCEDKDSSLQNVEKCVKTCAKPLESAQNIVGKEFNHFQDRLNRCFMSCNDTMRDKLDYITENSDLSKHTKEFDSCAKKCVDFHILIIPTMLKKIKERLKNEVE